MKGGIRQRDGGIETDVDQCLDLARVDQVHDLLRRDARPGNLVRPNTPHLGDMLARRRIVDRSLAGQLVALLAVLAAALPVALAGDHRGAAAFPPDVSGGQRDVDHGQTVLHALGMMFQSARVHRDGLVRLGKPVGGFLDGLRRHARHLRGLLRIIRLHAFGNGVPPRSVPIDELFVLQPVAHDDMQNAHQQREVGSRTHREIEVRVAGDRCHARIDDNQLAAAVTAPPDVVGGDGCAIADVRADHHQHVGLGDFTPGNQAAIHVKREFIRGSR